MPNIFEKNVEKVPQTFSYKMRYITPTLADQDEACKNPEDAYRFARCVKGFDIDLCQAAACKSPWVAYLFALNVEGADIKTCQDAACVSPSDALMFARYVNGAD